MKIVLREIVKDNPIKGLDVLIADGGGDIPLAQFTASKPVKNPKYSLIWRKLLCTPHQPDVAVIDVVRHDNNVTRVLYAYAREYAEKQVQGARDDTFVDETGFARDKRYYKPVKRKS